MEENLDAAAAHTSSGATLRSPGTRNVGVWNWVTQRKLGSFRNVRDRHEGVCAELHFIGTTLPVGRSGELFVSVDLRRSGRPDRPSRAVRRTAAPLRQLSALCPIVAVTALRPDIPTKAPRRLQIAVAMEQGRSQTLSAAGRPAGSKTRWIESNRARHKADKPPRPPNASTSATTSCVRSNCAWRFTAGGGKFNFFRLLILVVQVLLLLPIARRRRSRHGRA